MRSIFLKIFSRFAIVLAALTVSFSAHAQDIEITIGAGGNITGSVDRLDVGGNNWVTQRFIHNHRSALRTVILPYVAEHGEQNGEWLGNTLDIPGVPTIQGRNNRLWALVINGYDVNVNAKITDRFVSARSEILEIRLYIGIYGRHMPVDGDHNNLTVYAVKEGGYWSIYSDGTYRRGRLR